MLGRSRKLIKRRLFYPLKQAIKPLFKGRVYVSNHDFVKGFKITGNLGFLRQQPLTHKHRFLMSLDLAGKTIYDVGGHIGITTLFFSRAADEKGRVISFEPDPETFATLRQNVEMNNLTNVQLVEIGLAAERTTLPLVLAFGDSNSALATMDKDRQMTLLVNHETAKTVMAEVYPLDDYILRNSAPDPDFINIDVEGFEFNVLLGMEETIRRCKPTLLVEIHGAGQGQKLENYRKVFGLLAGHNYEFQEIVSRQRIVESNIELALKGRFLFCQPSS